MRGTCVDTMKTRDRNVYGVEVCVKRDEERERQRKGDGMRRVERGGIEGEVASERDVERKREREGG